MIKTIEIIKTKKTVRQLIFWAFAVAVCLFPLFFHQQRITWPLINAILILCVEFLSPSKALLIALIPSSSALASWLLPLGLAPMVPFIIISNAIYILVYATLRKKSFTLWIVSWSLWKALFLFMIAKLFWERLVWEHMFHAVLLMTSWPQFITALSWWIIALITFKTLKRYGFK